MRNEEYIGHIVLSKPAINSLSVMHKIFTVVNSSSILGNQ